MFVASGLTAQEMVLSGTVRDAGTKEPLVFAHILVKETGTGVVTNREGQFVLHLRRGVWTLQSSYIGYRPQTRSIIVHDNMEDVNFSLQPRVFAMPSVTVTPDDSLARLIIRRARQRRIERDGELQSYHMRAHTKVYSRLDSTRGMGDDLSAELTASFLDIGETQTEAWYKRPDQHKVLIHGRQQTDLFKQIGNTLNSSFGRYDFSSEVLRFPNDTDVDGPVSEAGLEDTYWYSVAGIARGERHQVYRIRVLPRSLQTPGVTGYYYIEDSTWSITQVELELNEATRNISLPIATKISFRQQFSLYGDALWLPSAGQVHVQAKLNLMGTEVWLSLNASTVIASYELNPPGVDSVFDDYRVEVLPEADDIPLAEWRRNSLQPPSEIDSDIYRISDSMEVLRAEELMNYNVGCVISGKKLQQDDNTWDVPGLINAVQFNRVEGVSISIPYSSEIREGLIQRYAANAGYGFLDRQFKASASARFRTGGRERSFIGLEAYYDLAPLYRDDLVYSNTLATWMALLDRYDARDYFYRKGVALSWSAHALPWLESEVGGRFIEYASARKHADWSIAGESVIRENAAVQEGQVRSVRLSLNGDFRTRTLMKGHVQRRDRSPSNFIPALTVEYRDMQLANRRWDALILQASLSGQIGFGVFGKTQYFLNASRATAHLPMQGLLTLPGSEPGFTMPMHFRTTSIGEFGGDERGMVMLDHNFGKLPFSWIGLPSGQFYAAEMWQLHLFAGAGWTRMRPGTRSLLTREVKTAERHLIEAGLSVENLFGIMRIDIGTRLTHFSDNPTVFYGLTLSPR
ncbi:DUF5686 and carboxypeptidase regulatory-like domain-containing protein [bacterium]|nr:DUF5686 and carboxypeptidase regulatory-like domain-containing protein [bacterium]